MCHPSARCMFTCSFVVTTQPTIEGLRFTQITPNTNEAFNFNWSFPNVYCKVYTSYSFYQSAFYDSRCLKLCSLFVPVSTCSAHVVKQQLKSCYFNVPLEAIGSHSVMLSLRKRCLAFYVNLILLFMETAHILAVSVTAALAVNVMLVTYTQTAAAAKQQMTAASCGCYYPNSCEWFRLSRHSLVKRAHRRSRRRRTMYIEFGNKWCRQHSRRWCNGLLTDGPTESLYLLSRSSTPETPTPETVTLAVAKHQVRVMSHVYSQRDQRIVIELIISLILIISSFNARYVGVRCVVVDWYTFTHHI